MQTAPSVDLPGVSMLSDYSRLSGGTAYADRDLREQLARLSATLVAAGRPVDARAVANVLLAEVNDGESRKALVKWALDWARPSADHVRWYAEAAERGADVESMEPALQAALHHAGS